MYPGHPVSTRMQAKRGGLANTDAVDMLAAVFKGVLEQTKVEPEVNKLLTTKQPLSNNKVSDC